MKIEKKNNGDDTRKINEDKGGPVIGVGESGSRSLSPPPPQVPPAAGPSCRAVTSKTTVGSSLASLV